MTDIQKNERNGLDRIYDIYAPSIGVGRLHQLDALGLRRKR